MESRTRLALGGMATVAASVAVVTSVAMSASLALTNSAGAPVAAPPVVVPSASSTPASQPEVTGKEPSASVPITVPEIVPAPAPEVVLTPSERQTAAAEPSATIEQQLVADVQTSGSWDSVHAWAEERGWPRGRVEALIARLEAKVVERGPDKATEDLITEPADSTDRKDTLLPAETGKTSGRDQSGLRLGSKREQSRVPPS